MQTKKKQNIKGFDQPIRAITSDEQRSQGLSCLGMLQGGGWFDAVQDGVHAREGQPAWQQNLRRLDELPLEGTLHFVTTPVMCREDCSH